MAEVCQAVAHGSLMGARGNSGVILSQVLRGHEPGERNQFQRIAAGGAALGEFVNRLIDEGRLPRGTGSGQFRRLRLHRIALDDETARSPLNNDFEYFSKLQKLGQDAARRFLENHYGDIGRRSTINEPVEVRAEVA